MPQNCNFSYSYPFRSRGRPFLPMLPDRIRYTVSSRVMSELSYHEIISASSLLKGGGGVVDLFDTRSTALLSAGTKVDLTDFDGRPSDCEKANYHEVVD